MFKLKIDGTNGNAMIKTTGSIHSIYLHLTFLSGVSMQNQWRR